MGKVNLVFDLNKHRWLQIERGWRGKLKLKRTKNQEPHLPDKDDYLYSNEKGLRRYNIEL